MLLLRRGRARRFGLCEVSALCAFGVVPKIHRMRNDKAGGSDAWPTLSTVTTERTPLRSLLRFVFL
eukprot:2771179-Prymnesium_polylepis.1